MIAVNHETAMRDPASHVFHYGRGYLHVGHPAMPAKPAAHATVAEPPAPAADDTWHMLMPPQGGKGVALRWMSARKTWLPVIGTGNRVGFTSEYLAAHGWKYVGPKAD